MITQANKNYFTQINNKITSLFQSTLFFRKVCAERAPCKILCVAPGGYDKIVIMNWIDLNIINAVAQAIAQSWPGGTQNTQTKNVLNQQLYEIKLKGNPWFSAGDESVAARQLLATIIQNLSKIGWKFHAGVNIKGGTDTMFFIQIPHQVNIAKIHNICWYYYFHTFYA